MDGANLKKRIYMLLHDLPHNEIWSCTRSDDTTSNVYIYIGISCFKFGICKDMATSCTLGSEFLMLSWRCLLCCYSIGSLGANNSWAHVSDVLVEKATLLGTTNGVRIKTWQVMHDLLA